MSFLKYIEYIITYLFLQEKLDVSNKYVLFNEKFTSYDNWIVENVLIDSSSKKNISITESKKVKKNTHENKFIIKTNNILNNKGNVLTHVGTSLKSKLSILENNIIDIKFNIPIGIDNIILIKLSDYNTNTDIVLYSHKNNISSRYIKVNSDISEFKTINPKRSKSIISNVHISAKWDNTILSIYFDNKLHDIIDISNIYDNLIDVKLNIVFINKNKKTFSKEEAFLYINSIKVFN